MAADDLQQPQNNEGAAQHEDDPQKRVLREHHLPIEGAFPYVPPKNWRPHQPPRKNSKGEYLDIKGRRWRKGPPRTEGETWEWDVQLPNGEHLNIDWGGNITHPQPKGRRTSGQAHRGLGGKGKRKRDEKK